MAAPSLNLPIAAAKRVLIVDDHRSLVEMLATVIGSMPGFQVVGWAVSAAEALQAVEREAPDIVILDLALQGDSGLAMLAQAKARTGRTRFLIFSGHLRLAAVRDALAAGVLAIIDKGCPLADFRTGLEQVAAGQPYYAGEAGVLIRQLVQRKGTATAPETELTVREQTVLRLLAEGASSKEIADRLGLSVHTVVNHRSKLMRKTGLHRVAQLSLYAAELGLVGQGATGNGHSGNGHSGNGHAGR